jgi:hypothetical protein
MRCGLFYVPVLLVISGCADIESEDGTETDDQRKRSQEIDRLLADADGSLGQGLRADEVYRYIMHTLPDYYATLGADVVDVHPGLFWSDGTYKGDPVHKQTFSHLFRMQPKVLSELRRRLGFSNHKPSNVCFQPIHWMMMGIRISKLPRREDRSKHGLSIELQSVSQMGIDAHMKTKHAVEFFLLFKGLSDYFAIIENTRTKHAARAIVFLETYLIPTYLINRKPGSSSQPGWFRWAIGVQKNATYHPSLLDIENFIALGADRFKSVDSFNTTVVPLIVKFFETNERLWKGVETAPTDTEGERLALQQSMNEIASGLNAFLKESQ